MSSIIVRQHEESSDGRKWNLIVKSLSMSTEKGGVYFNGIPSSIKNNKNIKTLNTYTYMCIEKTYSYL